jgi:hypothetical protein
VDRDEAHSGLTRRLSNGTRRRGRPTEEDVEGRSGGCDEDRDEEKLVLGDDPSLAERVKPTDQEIGGKDEEQARTLFGDVRLEHWAPANASVESERSGSFRDK